MRTLRKPLPVLLALLLAKSVAADAEGEVRALQPLDEIVVVAERMESPIRESTWSTSTLLREAIERLPARNLPDLLSFLPGAIFLEKDGSGHTPMAISRGFYGGGETEYVLLSVDGVPVNDVRTGLAEWNQISLSNVERVEVLRGGSSAVYGDAALGAVVNVVTRDESPAANRFATRLSFGDLGHRAVEGAYWTGLGEAQLQFHGSGRHSDGYRDNGKWEDFRFGGSYDKELSSPVHLNLRANVQRIDNEDPGPLTPDQIAENREQSNPFYREDHRRRDRFEGAFRMEHSPSDEERWSFDLGVNLTDQQETRTLLVTPSFGDTQFHDQQHRRYWSRAQIEHELSGHRLLGGIDGEYGDYDSRYFALGDRSSPVTEGHGDRIKVGAYVEAHGYFRDRVHASAGVRYDAIRDDHRNEEISGLERDFDEWSPRFGVNLAYSTSANAPGHVFANWTRAFKAPTLDQLYDRREITAGPELVINIANPDLRPQTSDGYEIGVYQSFSSASPLGASLTLAAYRIDLTDEIDFDLATFGYGNIRESRHDGFEGALSLDWKKRYSLTTTVNLLDVTFRSGDYEGNQLKAIPEVTVSNALQIDLPANLALGVTHKYVGSVYLDDENTTKIPEYGTFDGRLAYEFNDVRVHLSVMNVADARNNSTGFLLFDPTTFSQEQLLYPAQGRSIRFAIEI